MSLKNFLIMKGYARRQRVCFASLHDVAIAHVSSDVQDLECNFIHAASLAAADVAFAAIAKSH